MVTQGMVQLQSPWGQNLKVDLSKKPPVVKYVAGEGEKEIIIATIGVREDGKNYGSSLKFEMNLSKDFELEVFVEEAALIGGSLSDTYRSVGKVNLGQSSEMQGEIAGVFTTFVTPADVGPTFKLKFKRSNEDSSLNDEEI